MNLPNLITLADRDADRHRAAFIRDFKVKPCRWSAYNLSRLLRATGERPVRVAEIHRILGRLGLGDRRVIGYGDLVEQSGVFDHGELWSRDRFPRVLVGHPYRITSEQRMALAALARFPMLRVAVDDRPSFYGFGTHHVRVELVERRRPWKPLPSTPKTRAARSATRRAFAEEFDR